VVADAVPEVLLMGEVATTIETSDDLACSPSAATKVR